MDATAGQARLRGCQGWRCMAQHRSSSLSATWRLDNAENTTPLEDFLTTTLSFHSRGLTAILLRAGVHVFSLLFSHVPLARYVPCLVFLVICLCWLVPRHRSILARSFVCLAPRFLMDLFVRSLFRASCWIHSLGGALRGSNLAAALARTESMPLLVNRELLIVFVSLSFCAAIELCWFAMPHALPLPVLTSSRPLVSSRSSVPCTRVLL